MSTDVRFLRLIQLFTVAGVSLIMLIGPATAQKNVHSEERNLSPKAFSRATSSGEADPSVGPLEFRGGPVSSATAVNPGAVASVKGEESPLFEPVDAGFRGVWLSSSSAGDFNNDGKLDLIIVGQDKLRHPTATLYLGDGNGGFAEAKAGLTKVVYGSSTVGDVDGDGNLDVVILGEPPFESDVHVTLYLGDGEGGFAKSETGLTGNRGAPITLQDFNGDGALDLFTINDRDDPVLYLGDGNGGFTQAKARFNEAGDVAFAVADFNGDQTPDIMRIGDWKSESALYLGDGHGAFSKADADIRRVHDGMTSVGDVNGDSHPDVLVLGADKTWRRFSATLYLGDGNGRFTKVDPDLRLILSVDSASFADANGDGHLDLLIMGTNGDGDAMTRLYLGNGEGNFTRVNAGLVDLSDGSSTFGDVNGDGVVDLLLTGNPTNAEPLTRLYLGQREAISK